jgi:hypothetical protein
MAFKKGVSGNQNGRPKGVQNKMTQSVKEVFNKVFDELQEDKEANLLTWGKNNPTDFYKLCSKLIPNAVDVKGDLLVANFDLKGTIQQFFDEGNTETETSTSKTN